MLIAKCDVCGKTSEIELDDVFSYECKEARKNIEQTKVYGEIFDLCFDCRNELKKREKKLKKQILKEIKGIVTYENSSQDNLFSKW